MRPVRDNPGMTIRAISPDDVASWLAEGAVLIDVREDHDKTQQEIADMLHMQRSVYRRYELGEREIPVWALVKLSEYYGVTTDYLLGLGEKK